MAWTAPRTWVTGETVTAALMNAHIRDNFLETSAATVTTAGDLVYADAANSMGTRLAIGATHSLLVSDGSIPVWGTVGFDSGDASYVSAPSPGDPSTYQPLTSTNWGSGTDVAVTVTTSNRARVDLYAGLQNNAVGAITNLSYAVSGATTTASSDIRAIRYESSVANDLATFGGWDYATLTAGSNVFTVEANVTAGVSTITRPRIFVTPY